jgi:hypothetical protein
MATYRRNRETYRYALSRAEAFATAEALYQSESANAFSLRGIDSHALFAWRTRWPAHQGLDRDMGRWDWEMLAASRWEGRVGVGEDSLSSTWKDRRIPSLGFALVPEGRVVRYCERRIS